MRFKALTIFLTPPANRYRDAKAEWSGISGTTIDDPS